MSDLNVYVTTFNCGRNLVDIDHFASSLFHGLGSNVLPDLILLSLQELAPLGSSFLGGSFLATYFARISTALHDATSRQFGNNVRYKLVASRNVGMTAIMVFAHQDTFERIRSTDYAGIGVGVSRMGNKGAVGIRLNIEQGSTKTLITLIAAHLAPKENQCERRNQDWKDICEGLVFEQLGHTQTIKAQERNNGLETSGASEPLLASSEDDLSSNMQGIFHPHSHIIFAGDLNYRAADTSPTPDDRISWPQPNLELSHAHHYSKLLPRDQLARERKAGRTLHLLDEAPVNFPPTYKFTSAAQAEARHAVESMPRVLADGRQTTTTRLRPDWAEKSWLWAEHRVPSWCDRILFSSASQPKVHSYTALPLQPTSDHRPVAAFFLFSRDPPKETVPPPFELRSDWRERRAAARRSELVVGAASYLTVTWEGRMLLAGTIFGIFGGFWILKALLAAS